MSPETIQITDPETAASSAPAELLEVVQSTGVEIATQQSLLGLFTPFFEQAREWREKAGKLVITDASQVAEMKLARQSRLALKEIRINVERARRQAKEDSLRRGKAIDGLANVLKFLIEPIESHLLEQESFAERQEAARKARLIEERTAALVAYGVDPSFFSLAEMPAEHFDKLLNSAKVAHEAKLAAEAKAKEEARLAAEKAEQERIAREKAEAEERERIRLENERLKREALEREAREKAERERQEAERKAAQERAVAELQRRSEVHDARAAQVAPFTNIPIQPLHYADMSDEAFAAILTEMKEHAAERERLAREKREAEERARKEREAAAERERVEREARQKAEAELRAAEAAKIAREKAERKAAEKAARAPDREKLASFAQSIRFLRPAPLSSPEAKRILDEVTRRLADLAHWVEQEGGSL
jgi:hypothetical protein